MPTYEYRCRECDEVFEQQGSITEHDELHPSCPRCQSEDVEQVFSPFFARTSRKS